MHPTPQAQAVLLLTASLGKSDHGSVKPLSNREWARFAVWLRDHDLAPASLLDSGWQDRVAGWEDAAIPLARLEALLDRGAALGLALEKWQRAGLWVLTRSDADYPERLKKRLGAKAPPVLFGCGASRLLNAGGIAVVGSRRAEDDDLRFAEELGRQAAEQGKTIVSGGARGIDQCAMLGALGREGTAVGVLADSLLRSATSAKYRKYLVSNDLALVTSFNPEARFHVGSAMSRNKYIYCLADAGVVVSSTSEKGGTWHGAVENLKAAWVPLSVKRNDNPDSGNSELVRRGAHWWIGRDSLLALSAGSEAGSQEPPVPEADRPQDTGSEGAAVATVKPEPAGGGGIPDERRQVAHPPDFYRRFLEWMDDVTVSEPLGVDDIHGHRDLERDGLERKQVTRWLARGIKDKRVRKFMKPVRYQAVRQASLLRDET